MLFIVRWDPPDCAKGRHTAMPPGFEDVLQVQVVGYRERLITFHGHQVPVLDPVWTLVAKER
jgi:hypothetical protein